jgi:hypothetical protein
MFFASKSFEERTMRATAPPGSATLSDPLCFRQAKVAPVAKASMLRLTQHQKFQPTVGLAGLLDGGARFDADLAGDGTEW